MLESPSFKGISVGVRGQLLSPRINQVSSLNPSRSSSPQLRLLNQTNSDFPVSPSGSETNLGLGDSLRDISHSYGPGSSPLLPQPPIGTAYKLRMDKEEDALKRQFLDSQEFRGTVESAGSNAKRIADDSKGARKQSLPPVPSAPESSESRAESPRAFGFGVETPAPVTTPGRFNTGEEFYRPNRHSYTGDSVSSRSTPLVDQAQSTNQHKFLRQRTLVKVDRRPGLDTGDVVQMYTDGRQWGVSRVLLPYKEDALHYCLQLSSDVKSAASPGPSAGMASKKAAEAHMSAAATPKSVLLTDRIGPGGWRIAATSEETGAGAVKSVAEEKQPEEEEDELTDNTHLEIVRQGMFVGLRSAASGYRFLQPRRKAPHKLVFFNFNCGVWEQWEIVSASPLPPPPEGTVSFAGIGSGSPKSSRGSETGGGRSGSPSFGTGTGTASRPGSSSASPLAALASPWHSIALVLRSRRLPHVELRVDLVRVGRFALNPHLYMTPRTLQVPGDMVSEDTHLKRMSAVLVKEWFKFVDGEKALRECLEAEVDAVGAELAQLKLNTIGQVEFLRSSINQQLSALCQLVTTRDATIAILRSWLRHTQEAGAAQLARRRHLNVLQAWRDAVAVIVARRSAISRMWRANAARSRAAVFAEWQFQAAERERGTRVLAELRRARILRNSLGSWAVLAAVARSRDNKVQQMRAASVRQISVAVLKNWYRYIALTKAAARAFKRVGEGMENDAMADAFRRLKVAVELGRTSEVKATQMVQRRVHGRTVAVVNEWSSFARKMLSRRLMAEDMLHRRVMRTQTVVLTTLLGHRRRARRVADTADMRYVGCRRRGARDALVAWHAHVAHRAWQGQRITVATLAAARRRMRNAVTSWKEFTAVRVRRNKLVAAGWRCRRLLTLGASLRAWYTKVALCGLGRDALEAFTRRRKNLHLTRCLLSWHRIASTRTVAVLAAVNVLSPETCGALVKSLSVWWGSCSPLFGKRPIASLLPPAPQAKPFALSSTSLPSSPNRSSVSPRFSSPAATFGATVLNLPHSAAAVLDHGTFERPSSPVLARHSLRPRSVPTDPSLSFHQPLFSQSSPSSYRSSPSLSSPAAGGLFSSPPKTTANRVSYSLSTSSTQHPSTHGARVADASGGFRTSPSRGLIVSIPESPGAGPGPAAGGVFSPNSPAFSRPGVVWSQIMVGSPTSRSPQDRERRRSYADSPNSMGVTVASIFRDLNDLQDAPFPALPVHVPVWVTVMELKRHYGWLVPHIFNEWRCLAAEARAKAQVAVEVACRGELLKKTKILRELRAHAARLLDDRQARTIVAQSRREHRLMTLGLRAWRQAMAATAASYKAAANAYNQKMARKCLSSWLGDTVTGVNNVHSSQLRFLHMKQLHETSSGHCSSPLFSNASQTQSAASHPRSVFQSESWTETGLTSQYQSTQFQFQSQSPAKVVRRRRLGPSALPLPVPDESSPARRPSRMLVALHRAEVWRERRVARAVLRAWDQVARFNQRAVVLAETRRSRLLGYLATSVLGAWHEEALLKRQAHIDAGAIRQRIDWRLLLTVFRAWSGLAVRRRAWRRAAAWLSVKELRSTLLAVLVEWRRVTVDGITRRRRAALLVERCLRRFCVQVLREWASITAAELAARRRSQRLLAAAIRREEMLHRQLLRRAVGEWRRHTAKMVERDTSVEKLILQRSRAVLSSALHHWRWMVEERQEIEEKLKACIKRKKIAFQQFKQWYWGAFDEDVQDTIKQMFHQTDAVVAAAANSSYAPHNYLMAFRGQQEQPQRRAPPSPGSTGRMDTSAGGATDSRTSSVGNVISNVHKLSTMSSALASVVGGVESYQDAAIHLPNGASSTMTGDVSRVLSSSFDAVSGPDGVARGSTGQSISWASATKAAAMRGAEINSQQEGSNFPSVWLSGPPTTPSQLGANLIPEASAFHLPDRPVNSGIGSGNRVRFDRARPSGSVGSSPATSLSMLDGGYGGGGGSDWGRPFSTSDDGSTLGITFGSAQGMDPITGRQQTIVSITLPSMSLPAGSANSKEQERQARRHQKALAAAPAGSGSRQPHSQLRGGLLYRQDSTSEEENESSTLAAVLAAAAVSPAFSGGAHSVSGSAGYPPRRDGSEVSSVWRSSDSSLPPETLIPSAYYPPKSVSPKLPRQQQARPSSVPTESNINSARVSVDSRSSKRLPGFVPSWRDLDDEGVPMGAAAAMDSVPPGRSRSGSSVISSSSRSNRDGSRGSIKALYNPAFEEKGGDGGFGTMSNLNKFRDLPDNGSGVSGVSTATAAGVMSKAASQYRHPVGSAVNSVNLRINRGSESPGPRRTGSQTRSYSNTLYEQRGNGEYDRPLSSGQSGGASYRRQLSSSSEDEAESSFGFGRR